MSCVTSHSAEQLSVDGYNPCAFIQSGRHYESKEDYPKLADVWNARFQAWADNQMNISRAVARDRSRRCPGPPRFKRFLCIRKPLRRPSTIKARVASTLHSHPGICGKHAKSRLFKPYTCNAAAKGPADANVEKAANARILVREHLATRLRKDVRRSSRMKSSAKSLASVQAAALESQVRTITQGVTQLSTRGMDYKITALSFRFSRLSLGDKVAGLPLDFSHLSLDDPVETQDSQEDNEDGASSPGSLDTHSVADASSSVQGASTDQDAAGSSESIEASSADDDASSAPEVHIDEGDAGSSQPPETQSIEDTSSGQEVTTSSPDILLVDLGDPSTATTELGGSDDRTVVSQSLGQEGQSDVMDSEVPVLEHHVLAPTISIYFLDLWGIQFVVEKQSSAQEVAETGGLQERHQAVEQPSNSMQSPSSSGGDRTAGPALAVAPSHSNHRLSSFSCEPESAEIDSDLYGDMMMDGMPGYLSKLPWMSIPRSSKAGYGRYLPGHVSFPHWQVLG